MGLRVVVSDSSRINLNAGGDGSWVGNGNWVVTLKAGVFDTGSMSVAC